MNPFHEEQKKKAAAGLISFGLTIVFSLLGIYNWMELRSLIITMLAVLKVDPYAWQGIDNLTFIMAGVGWLAYVFYSQYYLRKQALAGRVMPAVALLLACQLWLLVLSRGIPALFGVMSKSHTLAITVEVAMALLMTAYVLSFRHIRRRAEINHGGRG
jgi:hypothetical protein